MASMLKESPILRASFQVGAKILPLNQGGMNRWRGLAEAVTQSAP
jgi:hypothetical protein